MKRDMLRLVGGGLLVAATLVVLPACVGSTPVAPTRTASPAAATPSPKPNAAPSPAPTAAAAQPTSTPVAASQPAPTAAGNSGTSSGDLVAQGKVIFEKTAGGVGCAYCHGLDGQGQGPAGLTAADIRGKQEADVRYALRELPMMSSVKLNDEEIAAVGAYMQTLK